MPEPAVEVPAGMAPPAPAPAPAPPFNAASQPTVGLPVVPPAGAAPPMRMADKLVCPNCYAVNAPGNNFCRECGNALPKATTLPPAHPAPPPAAAPHATAVLPQVEAPAPPAPWPPAEMARTPRSKGFGPADILGILALLALALAITPLFEWVKMEVLTGVKGTAFSYSGGAGVLPYAGSEWLTMGVVLAAAAALTLVFLLVRVGRGPMFCLAGCLCLFPSIYYLTRSITPMRLQGIELSPSPGVSEVFFGQAGLGIPIWLALGAGIALLAAAFLAPPRAITRILTLILFLVLVVVAGVFTALMFNFNLFIAMG